jgi:putative endonuclease
MPHVYILECADFTYYIGSTRDLEHRLAEHESGAYPDGYTAGRRPVKLVYSEELERIDDAWARERQLHGWSRAKKRALIEGRIDAIRDASRRRRPRTR